MPWCMIIKDYGDGIYHMMTQLITDRNILYGVDGHDVCLEPANVAEICRPRRGSMAYKARYTWAVMLVWGIEARALT